MPSHNKYKVFTAEIQTPTLLDDFVPSAMEDMQEKFIPIRSLKERFCEKIEMYSKSIHHFKGFEDVEMELLDSLSHMEGMFKDFEARMEYFTLVFFGAVSAGKTSMICDLANMNPHKLTEIISESPEFDSESDSVSIGPNVATINLYEILIEKSRIRLVDVPGIGGVVHDNNSLAPFVNMADCIVFLLNAGSDLTKDDDDFIYDHIAAIKKTESSNSNLFKTEKGLDKRVLVALNKWTSLYRDLPTTHSERDFKNKAQWILNGNPQNTFPGISGYFNKSPEIVKANTSYRDEITGESYPSVKMDLTEVIDALHRVLDEDCVDFRLNRPRQVISKEINRLILWLTEQKIKRSLEKLAGELDKLGIKTDFVKDEITAELSSRLNNIENSITINLGNELKEVIRNWKPSVGLWNGFVYIGRSDALHGKLKKEWGDELRHLIENNVDKNKITNLLKSETETFKSFVLTRFQVSFSDKDVLLKKISGLNSKLSNSSVEKSNISNSVNKELETIVDNIQTNILKDILNLISWDVILAAFLGVMLTPLGSAMFIAYRRWKDGKDKGQEAKYELESAIEKSAREVALEIRQKIASRFEDGVEDIHKAIKNMVQVQKKEVNEPLILINQIIEDLQALQTEANNQLI